MLELMEIHLNPALQARLDQLAADTGLAQAALVEDAVSGYVSELALTRETLNRRYDDIKNGRVVLIDGEDALARLKAKTQAQRAASPLA